MAGKRHCPFCDHIVGTDEETCPFCGAENREPKTIEELKEYCDIRGMPLSRMRFFIGVDYEKARAFGIYEDGGRFIVYKNKANGDRAVRYSGPDESYAVRELFLKLLDECHRRDIWPDGRPAEEPVRRSREAKGRRRSGKGLSKTAILVIAAAVLAAATIIWFAVEGDWDFRSFRNGYYRYEGNNTYYLKKGSYWFYGGKADWYSRQGAPSGEVVYLGDEYDPEWGVIEFEDSGMGQRYEAGEYYNRDSSDSGWSSSDYDSWDAGDTDWSSDW